MRTIAIAGETRENNSRQNLKSLRKEGKIPCVLYGGNEVYHFSVAPNDVKHLIYSPEFKIVDLDVNGSKMQCILKETQFHPVTDEIMHIDFLRLSEGVPVRVDVPVAFSGIAPGTRAGGKLIKKLRKVKIKTTPENLVDELILDVSKLKLGQSVRVRDIKVNENVEILSNMATPIASVEIPRALRSAGPGEEEDEEEEGAEGSEGEGAEGSAEGGEQGGDE